MAYVIAEPCIGIKDTACVTVCPVDVIHPRSDETGFLEADQLFINMGECIICDLCAQECPVKAVFQEDDLPPQWQSFIEKNKAYYLKSQQRPVGDIADH